MLLTAMPATITWTGGSATSANWSDAANWDLGRAPINGDSLVFPASAKQLANTDDIAGLSVNSIAFQGAFTASTGGYTLSGDDLTVGAGGITDNDSNSNSHLAAIANQIDFDIALGAAQTWSVGNAATLGMSFRNLSVQGNVDTGGFELTTAGSGTIDLAGQVSGSGGLLIAGNLEVVAITSVAVVGAPPEPYYDSDGALTVDLDHANTYTGGTNVETGTVVVSADGALGPGGINDAGTTVSQVGTIQFNAVAYTAPEAITLDGGTLEASGTSSFSGPISVSGTSSDETITPAFGAPYDAAILLMAPSATFTLNGPTLANNGGGSLLVQGDFYPPAENGSPRAASPGVIINNVISGSGGLTVTAGALALGAANTYQGLTNLFGAATLIVDADNAIPSASAVVLESYASPALSSIELGGHADTIGSLAGTQFAGAGNTVDLGTGGSLTTGGDNTSTAFTGDITGSGTLTKVGRGTFDLTGTTDYTGATNVNAGTLVVDGSTAAGNALTVAAGATLGGAGVINGTIFAIPSIDQLTFPGTPGGAIDPGAGPDPAKNTGTLSVAGGVTFGSNAVDAPPSGVELATFGRSEPAVFASQLGGDAANPANSQLKSAATVSLQFATLELTALPGAGPFNAGQQFVIIQAGAPIAGTFVGLPEGSAVSDGAQNFAISYANNRVTLTAQPLQPTSVYLNGQPGDSTAATFVHNLYRELLGREPSVLDQTAWTNVFGYLSGQGGTAAAQRTLVADFLGSPEYQAHLIEGIYVNFLHRPADAGGLAFWTAALADGVDEKWVLADFLGSDEYFDDAQPQPPGPGAVTPEMAAAAWVGALYRDVLGRPADASGLAFWTGQVLKQQDTQLTRTAIAFEFLGAGETEEKLLDSGNAGAAGSPADGAYAMAEITGNGWENLYFPGGLSTAAVDRLFAQLQAGESYGATIDDMLDMGQFFASAG